MSTADARETLDRLIRRNGETYAGISRLLGRNAAYVQQFIKRGLPARLDERDRQLLARYFGVGERELGGLGPIDGGVPAGMVWVPRLSVDASAGPGSLVEGEREIGSYGFDERWLRRVCRARPQDLSIIRVAGDSMAPTLVDGDDILVDRTDAGARLRDGIYVLRRDDTLMVKRLSLTPTSGTLAITSDNASYPSWRDVPLDSVDILGRVVWAGRTFG